MMKAFTIFAKKTPLQMFDWASQLKKLENLAIGVRFRENPGKKLSGDECIFSFLVAEDLVLPVWIFGQCHFRINFFLIKNILFLNADKVVLNPVFITTVIGV